MTSVILIFVIKSWKLRGRYDDFCWCRGLGIYMQSSIKRLEVMWMEYRWMWIIDFWSWSWYWVLLKNFIPALGFRSLSTIVVGLVWSPKPNFWLVWRQEVYMWSWILVLNHTRLVLPQVHTRLILVWRLELPLHIPTWLGLLIPVRSGDSRHYSMHKPILESCIQDQ